MRNLTLILLVIIVALASATGYLGYRVATQPTSLETLTGLTSDEMATVKALVPILSFSIDDVPGEVGGEAFIDDLGRRVLIPGHSPVERIVSLHPAATETIFYLDADDKLIGVSNAWTGNPWAPDPVESWITTPEDVDNEIERRVNEAKDLAALDAFSVEPEAILDLQPDVVFAFGYTLPGYAQAIQDQVPVVCFAPTTLEDVLQNLVVVGKVVGKQAEAESLISNIKKDIIDIAGRTIGASRPKVFCETGYNGGIWTTGEGSFVSSLIILAGGKDIGTSVPVANPNISPEYIADSEPEIIIHLDATFWGFVPVTEREGWGAIPAVINGKIYELDAESVDKVTRPGLRIAQGLEALLGIIHPELSK